jgi:hypothetical protein
MSLPGQPGQYGNQYNSQSNSGQNVYATQTGNVNVNSTYNSVTAGKRGPRLDTKVLLGTLVADVIFFFYGMLSYTGKNTGGDEWRAGIFLFLFVATAGMIGRWIRRRV